MSLRKRDELKGEPWSLSPPPLHLDAADRKYSLGASTWEKIEVVKLGWEKGALV